MRNVTLALALASILNAAHAEVRYTLTQDGQPMVNATGKAMVFTDPVAAGIALATEAASAPESLFAITAAGQWEWQWQGEGDALLIESLTWRQPGGTWEPLTNALLPAGPVVLRATTSDNVAWVEWVDGRSPHTVWQTDTSRPWDWAIDLSSVPPGQYAIQLRVHGYDGRSRSNNLSVTVDSRSSDGLFAVDVEWMPPTAREDGSSLPTDQLAGYTLLLQTPPVSGALQETFIPGGATTRHRLELPASQYQIQLVAVDSDGLRSDPSDPVVFNL